MAKDTNGIANVKDITEAFGVTLSTKPTLCPKYSVIIANSYLGVSGYTYTDKQLVRFQHIFKKEDETKYRLTITNFDTFLDEEDFGQDDGTWEFYINDQVYDGGNYPYSTLNYFDGEVTNYVEATTAQWRNLYNIINNNNSWSSVYLENSDSGELLNLSNHSNINIKTVINSLANGSNQSITLRYTEPEEEISKNIVFGFYDIDLVKEIDMTVTVTIYSNNGKTYTKTCDIAGGYNNGAYENRFYTGCTIPIEYTGSTPTNITYKYTIINNSTSNDCYFDFAEYYNGTRHYDREGFFVEGTSIKENDGTSYVATEIPFDSGFFAASDARLEFYFYNR